MTGPNSLPLAQAFLAACEDELQAPKPGNVHVFAAGHGMEAKDFIDSAHVAAVPLATPGIDVGARIFAAVEATFARVGQNTNLGIILLCAPLAQAALDFPGEDLRLGRRPRSQGSHPRRRGTRLQGHRARQSGGLGAAPRHDVTEPARVTLLEAMRASADRDRIAYQYAHDFEDIFALGRSTLLAARREGRGKDMATLRVYLAFLAAFPDSHVVRKFGADAGALVLAEARAFTAALDAKKSEEEARAAALSVGRLAQGARAKPWHRARI